MRRFAYRLALAVGRLDVDAVLAELPRRALLEWLAYAELEPWDQDRADARAAIVAATVYNAARGRGVPARRPADFFAYRAPKRKMDPGKREVFRRMMEALARGDPDQP